MREAELSKMQRHGAPTAEKILSSMANIGGTYEYLGQLEKGLGIKHTSIREKHVARGSSDKKMNEPSSTEPTTAARVFSASSYPWHDASAKQRRIISDLMRCIYASGALQS